MLRNIHVRVQHVGGRCDHENLRGHPENFITREDFDPSSDEETTKKTDRRATIHYAALGAGFVADCQGLKEKRRSSTILTKVDERIETKIIQRFRIMPDSRKRRNEEKQKWFNVLRWFYTNFAKAERRRSSSLKIRSWPLRIHFGHLWPPLTLLFRSFRVIKGKEKTKQNKKKNIIFLYINVAVVLYCIQQWHWRENSQSVYFFYFLC